jgi:hypothetical protein
MTNCPKSISEVLRILERRPTVRNSGPTIDRLKARDIYFIAFGTE